MQKLRWSLVLLCIALSGCGVRLGYPDGPDAATDTATNSTTGGGATKPRLKIFLSARDTKGDFNNGGIMVADSFCQSDSAKPAFPVGAVYRAMLVDGTNRKSLPGGQIAWVLAPDRTYVRADGTTVIGTTNGQGVFVFPLRAAISTTSAQVWTGISGSAWAAGNDCSGWTSDGSGASGIFGYANRSAADSLLGGTASCDSEKHVYCVQQPEYEED